MFYFLCALINGIGVYYFLGVLIKSFGMIENSAFFALTSFIALMFCLNKMFIYSIVTFVNFSKAFNRRMYEGLFRVGENDKDLQLGFYGRWPKPSEIPDNLLPKYINELSKEIKEAKEKRGLNGNF